MMVNNIIKVFIFLLLYIFKNMKKLKRLSYSLLGISAASFSFLYLTNSLNDAKHLFNGAIRASRCMNAGLKISANYLIVNKLILT